MKKSLKRIFAGLLSAVTLGCCLPAATLGANAEEAAKTYPRDFSYMTSAYGYFFYPEQDSDGNVTAKAYSTLASDYYDNHRYMHEIRDFTFDTWLNATFSATEDGYLKIGTTSNAVNSMGLKLEKFKGILEYDRVTYVCVSYKILGKTISASDNKSITVGPSRDWDNTAVKIPVTSTNNDWNFAYVSIADLNRSGNWLFDGDGKKPQFRIQLPDFNDTSVSIVLNYVGFCKDLNALNATKAKIEKANFFVENSVANRRYGDSAIGLYFNPVSSGSDLADLTITAPAGSGVPNLTQLTMGTWATPIPSASSTDEGYLKLTKSNNHDNEYTMKSTTAWTAENVTFAQAKYTIVRLKALGTLSQKAFAVGSENSWNNRAFVTTLSEAEVGADGWITLCVENAVYGSTPILEKNRKINVQLPKMEGLGSYVLDYVGFCATEQAKDETLAAIELANSVELVGVQAAENADDHAIRFVGKVKAASVDALNEAVGQLGFKLSNGTKTVTAEIDKVYKSIVAGGETLNAGEGEYFFTFVVSDVPTDAQVDFTVTAYVTSADAAGEILANSATVGYDAANNRLVKAKKN